MTMGVWIAYLTCLGLGVKGQGQIYSSSVLFQVSMDGVHIRHNCFYNMMMAKRLGIINLKLKSKVNVKYTKNMVCGL